MISAIFAFLQALPALVNGVNAFAGKYFDYKAQIIASRIGGDVNVIRATLTATSVEQQTRVAGLRVIASSNVLLFLVVGFALPWIAYEWRVVVWDNVINVGATATPPIKGNVAEWATTIITCLFGSGTAVTVGHMFFDRDRRGQ